MRNHNHASYKLVLTYADVDGKATTFSYNSQEHPICLEILKSFILTGKWSEENTVVSSLNGSYHSRSHAIGLYEDLPWRINSHISERCVQDESYAAKFIAAAAIKAKEMGKSISTAKAKITRMKNKGENFRLLEHEYYLLAREYKLFSIVDFDYQEPVCACCGKTYPVKYTLNVNGDAYCMCCANNIVNSDSVLDLDAETLCAIKSALYESPDNTFEYTDEQINHQIQFLVSSQAEFMQFVNRIAQCYNAGEEDRNILHIYDKVWKEETIEKFNANIHSIIASKDSALFEKIATQLLMPIFPLEDVKILLKQLIV